MKTSRIIPAGALFLLSLLLLTASWAQARQSALSDRLIRLHVLAESDSPEDQSRKLDARDAVLSLLTPVMEDVRDREEAGEVLRRMLPAVQLAAERAAGVPARATLGEEYYPTREYGSFALPAGRYVSLRITLGEGRGHNCWCVVYPPLCTASVEETVTEAAALSGRDTRLITEDGTDCVFRFRIIELWGELRHRLED